LKRIKSCVLSKTLAQDVPLANMVKTTIGVLAEFLHTTHSWTTGTLGQQAPTMELDVLLTLSIPASMSLIPTSKEELPLDSSPTILGLTVTVMVTVLTSLPLLVDLDTVLLPEHPW